MPTRSLLAALFLIFGAAGSQAAEYTIDPTHTYASFEIDHHGFSMQRGQFNQSSGIVEFDPEAKTGRVDIRIAVASLDTGMAKRDEILLGENWFRAKDFPDLLFRSDKLVFTGDKLTAVEGKLAMLGQIRPVHLEVTRFKCGLNLANRKRGCGADALGVLKRSEFGMEQGLPFIGDEVRLRIQVEAYLP
ncbi:YceI family protein [Dechloromonas sp. XY25]|uniref:YceI family protein n=1 Tax=Dechloromonas hankyongensis TaxID=2908002 RepID=A0ABS9JWX5_9RHOO|nr:YceI family protein [Dechloromonas hankyongensis]MCG2575404.1 YceI family protein [Dechloromonas hankyongensis]